MTPEEKEKTLREALKLSLNTLEKGIEVRIGDSWPALKTAIPETIRVVKKALESTEPELQYREPRMPEDWGKEVEVSDDKHLWSHGILTGESLSRNVRWMLNDATRWAYARIRVTEEERAKQ